MRATILVSVNEPGQAEAATAWFAKWRPQLTYCSDNRGCGCCVDTWDVDGPEAAIQELPPFLRAMSSWTHPHRNAKAPERVVRKKGQKLPKPRW